MSQLINTLPEEQMASTCFLVVISLLLTLKFDQDTIGDVEIHLGKLCSSFPHQFEAWTYVSSTCYAFLA
jgi:hypothetical protein